MKVRSIYGFNIKDISIEEALEKLMTSDCGRGQLENMQHNIEAMREVLARFMAQHIKTVDQLNELVGYPEYKQAGENNG